MAILTDTFNRGFDEGFGRDVLDDAQIGPSQPNITVGVDSGDISGGSTSAANAQAAQEIEEFASEGGGVLAKAYGENFIAGHLILHKFTAGTPNTSIVYIALGDGQGQGGGHGEWDSAVAVYYAGAAQSVSPNGSTAGYRFYNGFISSDVATGNQPVDPFLTNLAYSGTPYIAVKLTDAVANAEDRPDKLRARIRCRRVFDFDSTGRRLSASATYSTNAARISADVILSYFEHKTPRDPALALRRLQEKVDWENWDAFKKFCDALIPWFNGTSTPNIARFETHIAFTGDVILADALDQICATAGAFWQDDGERIVFLPPDDSRLPVHHFDESSIVNGVINITPRDLRERPNVFVCEFRDYDDIYLGLSSTEVRREELKAQVGEIKSTRALPNMRKTQADRLLERQARLEADNPNILSFTGDEASIHVLPGDFVTVSHEGHGLTYQRCLVLSVSLSSMEDGSETCEFTAQMITDLLYSDTAHGPRQEALTP